MGDREKESPRDKPVRHGLLDRIADNEKDILKDTDILI